MESDALEVGPVDSGVIAVNAPLSRFCCDAPRSETRLSTFCCNCAICLVWSFRLQILALIAARVRQAPEGFTLTWKVLMVVVCYDPALCSAYRGVYTYTPQSVKHEYA